MLLDRLFGYVLTKSNALCTQIKQPKKTLSNKEKKKKERLKAARKKAGETVSDSEEEDY